MARDLAKRVKEHEADLNLKRIKPESVIVNHHIAKINNKMQIVESSLIWYFTCQDCAVNLNHGFTPKNILLSYYI